MKHPRLLYGLVLLAELSMPASGNCADVFSTIRQFGLGGVYRPDCSQPISDSDYAWLFQMGPDNRLRLLMYTDARVPLPISAYLVIDAQILDSSNIQFTLAEGFQSPNEIVFRKTNDKLRMWLSAHLNQTTGQTTTSVLNGKVIDGPDTEWLEECGLPQIN